MVTAPLPSMPLRLWGDTDGARYRAAYFSRFPGVWCHGDWITLTDRGSCTITGRSDATLNRGGVRLGTSEFYTVDHDEFSEDEEKAATPSALAALFPAGASVDAAVERATIEHYLSVADDYVGSPMLAAHTAKSTASPSDENLAFRLSPCVASATREANPKVSSRTQRKVRFMEVSLS